MLFDEVSLGINEGDRIGIVGINGTGKSTFLKLLAGVEEPDAGRIIKGREVRLAYLPQNPEFSDEKTLLENVTEGLSALVPLRSVSDSFSFAVRQTYRMPKAYIESAPQIYRIFQRKIYRS